MSLYRSKVIVLRSRNLGEADRVLVLLSEDRGKFEAVVKGARRQRSRFVGNTLPFNCLHGLFFTGKNLDTMSQAELIHSFASLHQDLERLAYGSYWMELVDAFLPEREEAGEIFRFLLAALVVLEHTSDPELLNLAFQIRLLNYLGYQPHLSYCSACTEPDKEVTAFSAAAGGALCSRCSSEYSDAVQIVPEILRDYAQLAGADLRQLSETGVAKNYRLMLRGLLQDFVGHRLDRPLKSQTFLDSVLT